MLEMFYKNSPLNPVNARDWDLKDCPECDGHGVIQSFYNADTGQDVSFEVWKSDQVNNVFEEEVCPNCHGNGWVRD